MSKFKVGDVVITAEDCDYGNFVAGTIGVVKFKNTYDYTIENDIGSEFEVPEYQLYLHKTREMDQITIDIPSDLVDMVLKKDGYRIHVTKEQE